MKLRKTWIGICVGVIYLVGIIFAIGVTGFVSGLFPAYDRYLVAGGTIGASIAAAFLVSFILGKIGDKVNDIENVNSFVKPVWLEIMIVLALTLAGVFVFNHSAMLTTQYTGNMSLYDSAMLAATDNTGSNLSVADTIYVGLLRIVISFLGNSLSSIYVLNLILRILMVIFMYIAIRLSLGMLAAIASGIAFIAIPAFGYSLHVVDSQQLLFSAVGLELMLVVMYVMGFEKNIGNRWFYKFFSILLGAFMGTMIYLEAGSAAIIVFLIAAWMLADMECETINICVNEILLLLSGVAAFIGMLIYEGGTDSVPTTYHLWSWRFYGYNESSWLKMINDSRPNTILAFGLLAAALMPAALTILRDRCEKIVPWLAFSVIGIVTSVFLGDTLTNSEVFIISSIVVLISCGVTCLSYNDIAEDIKEEPELEGEEDEEAEEQESVDDKSKNQGSDDSESGDQDKKSDSDNQALEQEPQTVARDNGAEASENNTTVAEGETEESESKGEDKKEQAPRYVPEGMVLPTGDEDEENLVPNFNMKRPEMADIGILFVGTPKKDKAVKASEETDTSTKDSVPTEDENKDDFDVVVKPGDDFDI